MPAGRIMANAYREATKDHKNIFVIFHASWCVWCHKMDDCINKPSVKPYFDSNYVFVHLTVEEKDSTKNTPGAMSYLQRYHGDKAGLPFWVVTDNRGNWLGDSYIRKEGQTKDSVGVNIGCPAEDNEVKAFCDLLKKTSHMNDAQLTEIGKLFSENKSRPVKKKKGKNS
jgi:hypothetical protein